MKKLTSNLAKLSTGAVLASLTFAMQSPAQTSDPVLNALIKKGVLTEAEAKQVLAEVESQKKDEELKKAKEAKTSPWVLPLGKEAHLKLGGFIHGNAEFGNVDSWQGSFNDTSRAVNDRFRLRRARINVSGDFWEHFDFKLEGDFAQGDGLSSSRTAFSGTDIFLNYNKLPEANLRFGQYKAPFGLEQITSDTVLFTAERSQVTSALTPERQLGVELKGKPFSRLVENKDLVEYSFGVFNGNGRNTVVNDNNDFMYTARLTSTPVNGTLFGQPVKWKLGGNGFYNRYAAGSRIGQSGNLLLNSDGSLSSLTVSGDARVWGWGADQSLTIGPFDLIAEYLENKVGGTGFNRNVTSARQDFVANGYYVQGSYFLPGRKFQLVGKWENFNPGQERYLAPSAKRQDDIRSLTAGFNWYIKGDNLKLMLNYIHTWSDFRAENTHVGDSEFDMAMVRVQVMF